MLPDHSGPQFRHVNAKVVQYDVRDEDFNLIPPWEFLNSLRADTLFVAAVELLVWDIVPNERMRKRALSSQARVKSLKVLRASPIAAVSPAPETPTGGAGSDRGHTADEDVDMASSGSTVGAGPKGKKPRHK
ncbi:hypothetical protein DENSPDRAFT_880154 [Dentipellis sp. KUC8613]|nr:hypothetical protein DENSPDRAFT_880154 [Dentipellis sp. KUC8613]